jgi:hypothetical protein
MKVKNITDVNKFLEIINHCKGTVELVTTDGDRLNLKSKLCQYIALTQMFSEAKIEEVEIIAYEPEDTNMILEYLIRG